MKRAFALLLIVCGYLGCAFSQAANPRLEAVRKYILEKDYPEVFGDSQYRTRVEGFLDADVDNDGTNEVVILFHPHYRQSAPILIYKVSSDMTVKRVAEGLAPGPLQPLTGDYLDSHGLGQAIDMEIPDAKATPENILGIMSKNQMNGLVIYDSFIHSDGRLGLPYFIDERGVRLPAKTKDCGSFEFSTVKQIAAGHLREDTGKNYLAAWVGDDIYVYLIEGESEQGLLNKKQWIIKAPVGFNGFIADQGLMYQTGSKTAILTLK